MSRSPSQLYTDRFYSARRFGSARSAEVVLDHLRPLISGASVLDVGCGTGEWLAVARRLGAVRTIGIDGHHVDPRKLQIKEDEFRPADLTKLSSVDERFDLVLCLEVAEHLPPAAGRRFVQLLCGASDVVLFSAAIPGQAGVGHINTRWQSYWISVFSDCGYSAWDVIRPSVWRDPTVDYWYSQNTLLYVRSAREVEVEARLTRPRVSVVFPDLVHPRCLEGTTAALARQRQVLHHEYGLRRTVRRLPSALLRTGRKHYQRVAGCFAASVGKSEC